VLPNLFVGLGLRHDDPVEGIAGPGFELSRPRHGWKRVVAQAQADQ